VNENEDTELLAQRVGDALLRQGHRLTTAESCTGGWVAACVTAVPGSSDWFDRGFVTYSNEAKQDMLGVPAPVLENHGAVSEETARAMVLGALWHSLADCAVAITGIAGPSGAVPGKPVGTVWIAWGRRGEIESAGRFAFSGDRRLVRRQAVVEALRGLLRLYGET
jgi:nicotinamide-nucleotide amidase